MSREIKFRAWEKDKKFMFDVFGFDVNHICGWLRTDEEKIKCAIPTHRRDCELMQFTGLKDKNGVDIFEGDIINLINCEGDTINVVCEFGTARRNVVDCVVDITGFYFKLDNGKKSFPVVDNYLGKHDLELFEVIGNIHEHPELLEVSRC